MKTQPRSRTPEARRARRIVRTYLQRAYDAKSPSDLAKMDKQLDAALKLLARRSAK